MSAEPGDPDRWARLRFAIIGPLLAAPPRRGELRRALQGLAEKHWQHPVHGTPVQFSVATLERWLYAARHAQDPVAALRRRRRRDAGRTRRLSAPFVAALTAQYQAHPNWSVQLLYDNLAAAVDADPGLGPLASYPTVRRYLKATGLHRKRWRQRDTPGAEQAARRLESREVRSFEAEHVLGLVHLDFHHTARKVLSANGTWASPLLLGIIDDHSRLICHLQWYLAETTEVLVHGLCQALQKRGLPRALMTDNGAAMQAEEFRNGLHTLGIVHESTLPYSPHQNAKQETFWATLEGRLMAMLEGVHDLTLARLNAITQVWVERDYHRSRHTEIATTPLRRFLDDPQVGRVCPDALVLLRAFRCTVSRRQRRSDATFSLAGVRFEVPNRYRHLERLQVAYARWDLRNVELIDPHTGAALCRLFPLDKAANADAQRRPLDSTEVKPQPPSVTTPELPPLLRKLLAEHAATGRPPAYLPFDTEDTES